jgi:predicted nucleic acid-binding Zn ribbon protein
MYCGISIPPKEVFCSGKCRETFTSQRQKALRNQRFMILFIAVIFALGIYLNLR